MVDYKYKQTPCNRLAQSGPKNMLRNFTSLVLYSHLITCTKLFVIQTKITMSAAGAFRRFINSETGPKTVHFWAPMMKWGLVIAGVSEMARPVEKVSATQQLSLFATGAIWTRWAMVIKPKNYLLASVNFFLGAVSIGQIIRIYSWRTGVMGDSFSDALKYMLDIKDEKKIEPVSKEVLSIKTDA